jgi:hypothetical protein
MNNFKSHLVSKHWQDATCLYPIYSPSLTDRILSLSDGIEDYYFKTVFGIGSSPSANLPRQLM